MIRYISLFSGIGAFEKAMRNIGMEFELVRFCEKDKFATFAYECIHNAQRWRNLGDIVNASANDLGDIDLLTYGFPCQDISLAGKMNGFTDENGNRTRSGLFYEAARIISESKPKIAIAENVSALLSKKFKNEFSDVIKTLDELGYNSYYSTMNATDYGVPQNRNRVFIVSVRKDFNNHPFEFPKKQELVKYVGDFLEKEVDDCFYITKKQYESVLRSAYKSRKNNQKSEDAKIFHCIRAHESAETSLIITSTPPKNKTKDMPDINVRKITPLECFRLMGFDDIDFRRASIGASKTQLYKMAGNSIVVQVAERLLDAVNKQYFNDNNEK